MIQLISKVRYLLKLSNPNCPHSLMSEVWLLLGSVLAWANLTHFLVCESRVHAKYHFLCYSERLNFYGKILCKNGQKHYLTCILNYMSLSCTALGNCVCLLYLFMSPLISDSLFCNVFHHVTIGHEEILLSFDTWEFTLLVQHFILHQHVTISCRAVRIASAQRNC